MTTAPPPPREPTVRKLSPSDAAIVRRVMQAAFTEYATPDFTYGTEAETDASIRRELETTEEAWAAFDGEEPVAVVKCHEEPDTGLLYFWRLGVLPSHRGHGLADRLIDHLATIARQRGLRGLACNVVPRHRGLVRVYERHGMRLIGEVPFTTPAGRSMTLLRLEGMPPAADA